MLNKSSSIRVEADIVQEENDRKYSILGQENKRLFFHPDDFQPKIIDDHEVEEIKDNSYLQVANN